MKSQEAPPVSAGGAPSDSNPTHLRGCAGPFQLFPGAKPLGKRVEASSGSSRETEAELEPSCNHKVGADAGLRERSGTSWK